MAFFKKKYQSKKSRARLGEINTAHGQVKTPAFVPVATKGTLKTLTPKQIKEIGVQLSFVNTYHLVVSPGVDVIEKAGGIHKMADFNWPLMSDSGGFQVFSLARQNFKSQITNIKKNLNNKNQDNQRRADIRGEESPLVKKISEDGVKFRSLYDGRLIEFTPEKSMEYQMKIGADLNMAFDECTYYPATYEYTEKAMERTHNWLVRCVNYKRAQAIGKKQGYSFFNKQYLYGIIQGGTYTDLRKKSAEFVASQPVDGVAIGGVSVGETKKEMRKQVGAVAGLLPDDRPVHLLGVGQFDDIIDLVKCGIDTFDCVEPTRLARMGILLSFSDSNKIDINKGIYKNNLEVVDKSCGCWVCQTFTKAYLHHLFKQKEILGYTLATYHNLSVMEKFMGHIREMIGKDLI
ncbi:tRNA guanosine(34) transglycosylase Tgt [Candidatus Roizmanbacteria bacterium]|nr:tRNA guanosine(34) transglycosylase Tgt [Candidatus Roizmanbacteria bacterium]